MLSDQESAWPSAVRLHARIARTVFANSGSPVYRYPTVSVCHRWSALVEPLPSRLQTLALCETPLRCQSPRSLRSPLPVRGPGSLPAVGSLRCQARSARSAHRRPPSVWPSGPAPTSVAPAVSALLPTVSHPRPPESRVTQLLYSAVPCVP